MSRADDLRRIERAIDDVSPILLRFADEGFRRERKASGDWVTEADLEVDAVLRESLVRDDEAWLSEEAADDLDRLAARRVWIVDPLDGTKEFVQGIPEWCVSIALVEDGIPLGWTNLDNGGPFAWVTTADPSVTANQTGGAGEAATADSDAFNGAGDPYDAELWTNPFDLSAATAATFDYLYAFNSLDTGDFFDIDITTDRGGAWTNLVSYADDAVGPDSLDLSAYAGMSNVQLRFRYYGDSWDWYAQVDELALSCSEPSITMAKTVGTTPGVCAATDTIVVPPGTDVYYCYTVTNTGNVTLNLHDLVDDQLGTLLDDYPLALDPGNFVELLTTGINITTTTVNVATWTAFNPDPMEADESEATDSATVIVLENDTCGDAIELTCPQGGGTFSVLGSTLLASYTGPFYCDTSHTAPELWYTIMGNGGNIEATTCSAATTYDTKLSVFDGGCGSLNCVVGIDDDPACPFSSLQSTVNWVSVPDVEYQIMVHGYSSGVGDFELTITCDIPVELQSILVE
jgi:hypothetical protein